MYLSIVIPAYNEEQRLGATLQSVVRFAQRADFPTEVLVVDDGSTDGTAEVVRKAAAGSNRIRLIGYQPNRGKGYAVREGMLAAGGKYRLLTDADGSIAVEQVTQMLAALREQDAELAVATRYNVDSVCLGERSSLRGLLSRIGRPAVSLLALPGISDTQCGFKLFKGPSAVALFPGLSTHRWGFDLEILAKARAQGMKIVEVPIQWTPFGGSRLVPWAAALSVLATVIRVAWCLHTGQYRPESPANSNRVSE